MATKIWPYDTPGDYTYDSDKIDIAGSIVSLKENLTNVYARWHLNEATGATVLDTSGNGRDGTPVNNPVSVPGKLNNALQFNGSTQYVNFGNIANFERTQAFSIILWVKTSMTTNAMLINHIQQGSPFTGWQFYKATDQKLAFSLVNNNSSNTIQITGSTIINDGTYHFLVMTYDGSSSASGVRLYVDGVLETMTIVTDTLSLSTLYTVDLNLGRRSDNSGHIDGDIDETRIYDRVLTPAEITYLWNSGDGREDWYKYVDNPTVEPTVLFDPASVSSWDDFLETLGGGNQGSIAYNLYKINKANKYYWNGGAWVTGGSSSNYNSIATISANISTFDGSPDLFGFLAYLISDGEQKVELDQNTLSYTDNQNPLVNAGTDKSVFDNQSLAPFSDCSFSDPDGTVDFARYKIIGEVDIWTDIPQGGYGSLLEAVQAFTYQFDNPGIVTVSLQVEDDMGAISEDSLLMTVQKYTVTFNVKDNQGNHLGSILFNAGDGSGWIEKNSPFTHDYDYSPTSLTASIDKEGYQIQTITVPTTIHAEDITLIYHLTREDIADAVWDELRSDHITIGTFGEAINIIYKIATGRWKIINYQLIFYDEDNATPIWTFDLKDSSGLPTETDPAERIKA